MPGDVVELDGGTEEARSVVVFHRTGLLGGSRPRLLPCITDGVDLLTEIEASPREPWKPCWRSVPPRSGLLRGISFLRVLANELDRPRPFVVDAVDAVVLPMLVVETG